MLAESFIAASSSPPKLTSTNATLLKDAGVFLHSYLPQSSLRSTFKRSLTAPNCLAISDSHVFAAQLDKAVVNIYNRTKGNHEATVPFPERIRSLVLIGDGAVVVLGTEEGNILLWETCSGRQLAAPQSHLQAVTTLAVDSGDVYLLSGSDDSNVLVWSLVDLLSFQAQSALAQHESIAPKHTLSAHRSAITSIVTGKSATTSSIAISASRDESAVVWDLCTGVRLRTFLLPSSPLCLALDPADRAFYAGYEDGSVQIIEFYSEHHSLSSPTSIRDTVHASTPLQPPLSSRWIPPNQEVGSTLSLSISYDCTTILSGHSSGRILSWDIASGIFKSLIAEYPGSSITHLQFLPPAGFPNKRLPSLMHPPPIKPRPHESFSSARGHLSEAYSFNVQLGSSLDWDFRDAADLNHKYHSNEILRYLMDPLIPASFVDVGRSSFICRGPSLNYSNGPPSIPSAPDHNSFSVDRDKSLEESAELIEQLKKQIEHLKRLQTVSTDQLAKITHEAMLWKRKEDERVERRSRKELRRHERRAAEWDALKISNTTVGPSVKGGDEKGATAMNKDDDDLSETTTPSEEEFTDEG